MSSPVLRGGDMPVTEAAIRDAVRQVLLPLWNVWYFFSLYANADGYDGHAAGPTAPHLLDRYVLAKTGELVADGHRPDGRVRHHRRVRVGAVLSGRADQLVRAPVPGPVLGRRPRTRSTRCYTVLETLCRVVAPLAPLTAEEIWRGLTGGRSVHLTDWPSADAFPADHELVVHDGRGPGRLPRPRCRCARPAGCGCGCRWPTLTVAAPGAPALRAVRRPGRRRGQRQGGGVHRGRRRRTASRC